MVLQVWIQENLPLASSKEYGTNLQSVQQLMKTNEVPSPANATQIGLRWASNTACVSVEKKGFRTLMCGVLFYFKEA